MDVSGPALIPADVRGRLRSVQLRARRAAGQQGVGLHASRSRGAGLEFAQYRAYEPGDELRQIDWKLYARSDRFFVREAERESPLTLWLLLDASASAGQSDEARPGHTRLDTLRGIAACASELALRQGDRFGLIVFGGDRVQLVPAGVGTRQRDRIWLTLQGLQAEGGWPSETAQRVAWERSAAHDLVLMLGDGFDEAGMVLGERLAKAGREVVQLQVLGADERDFSFRGGHRFRDPETGEELLGDADALRADYLRRFGQALREREARWQAAGIRHATQYLDEPLDAGLQRLFGTGAAWG